MSRTHRAHLCAGFTLVEVLIASALAAALATGVAHLIAIGMNAARSAREQTFTTALALSKIEELRSLAWSYEPGSGVPAVPRSDPALSPSPPGTLGSNVPPYVDYVDRDGHWAGDGPRPPAHAAFVRRWSIRPVPAAPARTVVLSVLVTSVAQDHSRRAAWTARSGTETLLVTLNTRKGRQ
jgi:prepilin-type N-terminal cleavage/methylation domain-containing protein